MELVRTAALADREQIQELWRICFGDSPSFTDWFFRERFFPSLSSCLEKDGRIVSALQSYPIHVRIRGRILPASMLAGVSTHPQQEGRGYMRQIFLHYMQSVRGAGIPIAVHTPAHLQTFFSRGHYPATDARHLTIRPPAHVAAPSQVTEHSLYEALAPLHACYQKVLCRYSGSVSRSLADFYYKFRDYGSDQASCLVLWDGDDVLGYCVYFTLGSGALEAEETVARDSGVCRVLMDALCARAHGQTVSARLPADLLFAYPNAQSDTQPQGVMGVADVALLLASVLGDGSLVFSVQDGAVPQNTGVFTGAGVACDRAPHVTVEAGRLGQLLCGYASVEELEQEQRIAIYDAGARRALETLLPKVPCFIVDTY